MTTTKTYTVLRYQDAPNKEIEASDFAIKDNDLYLYDDGNDHTEDRTVAVFPASHWSGILVGQ